MGIAIGIVLIAATIASFVMINARVGRMAKQYSDDSVQHGGHHGDGGHFSGGHQNGFSGGDGGGHHH
jgi:hypothetical protein